MAFRLQNADGSGTMDELKLVTASNIIKLRTGAGMTQAELGEKLSYSDKSISKWERGDGLPDAWVLQQMARLFGVTVDYLLTEHDDWKDEKKPPEAEPQFSSTVVTLVSLAGLWTLAVLAFVIFWVLGSFQWIIFAAAVPASLITLLVMNSVWRHGKHNVYIVAAIVLTIFTLVYLVLAAYHPWQIFLAIIPAEAVVFLSFRIKKH